MTRSHSLTAPVAQRLSEAVRQLQLAPQGQRQRIIEAAARDTGLSTRNAYRHMLRLHPGSARKPRADAGRSCITQAECLHISAVLMQGLRKNSKQLLSLAEVVDALRYDGTIRCERVCPGTGEIVPASIRTIERALRSHGLHPQQLLRPAPATELRVPHPNHTWQIDASLCVLYYLKPARAPKKRPSGVATGEGAAPQQTPEVPPAMSLQVMRHDEFYKNKPANLQRIAHDRVWRYVVTDRYSGALFVHYVLGAESGANLAESFMHAISRRRTASGASDPFHGVPLQVMMDRGAANTSGLFANLARRLGVRLLAHAPGNARATGQVEKAQDIVERRFESSLRLQQRVQSLEVLNALARLWAVYFNATAIHSRHGRTRLEVWREIQPQQLRIAPPAHVLRLLLTETPQPREVSVFLTVQFGGREFDVRSVPQVQVGEKLLVATNPWQADSVSVITVEDGVEHIHTAPLVQRDSAGQRLDAAVPGQSFATPPATRLQRNLQQVQMLATGTSTPAQAAKVLHAAQKPGAEFVPFGGAVDMLRRARQANLPAVLPRKGQQLQLSTRTPGVQEGEAAPALLSHFEAVRQLCSSAHLGRALTPDEIARLRQSHPHGVPEADIAALAQRLQGRARLHVIDGQRRAA